MTTGTGAGGGRFPAQLMYAAAVLYYLQDATQADIAAQLQTSRATVSRLLSEARRSGIVTIEVKAPAEDGDDALAVRAAEALGLERVYVFPDATPEVLATAMGPALSTALTDAGLSAGDIVLLSSGRMLYTASRATLPPLPGVLVAPTVGGQAEPEPWYQTNEITREFAARVGGSPAFLHAPALPGAALLDLLLADEATSRVLEMWDRASCAVVGVGAPPRLRQSLPHFARAHSAELHGAVGDVCTRFFDARGEPVDFPGSERVVATTLDQLRAIPVTIAVALGTEKLDGIRAGARAGFFTRLVTDASTAAALAAAV